MSTPKFRVISIDPGSNNTGFSVIDFDPSTGWKDIIFSETINQKDSTANQKALIEIYGERPIRIKQVTKFLGELIDTYEPDVVVSEAPFMGRFPAAFRALAELVFAFKALVIERYSPLEFVDVDPPSVKKAMGVNGKSSDKDDMTNALISRDDLSYAEDINVTALDEHAVDSICVGLWFIGTISK